MNNKWLLALPLSLALVFSMTQAVASGHAKVGEKKTSVCLSPKMVLLKVDMQKVWIDHTIWTRSYIVSAISNRPDQKDVLDRLLRNQQDVGNIIKPYYGDAAGNKLADLLREHILIAGKIVDAAKAGNQADVEKLDADWHRNADDIAKFLSSANPNWQFKVLQDMLYEHLQLIKEIVLDCLKGDWKADIAATDKNKIHMIHLADILTEGIVKQFPINFKRGAADLRNQ
ncbi:glycosyltransferase [Paenibacillus dokdonensis]|uniref:Glycosyltransferase n=1 Tax=Paenibacillus dokdonensis TaxID=2567944 RepID=A0ABU6GK93_9BACL|nr:glycosyltransferase [Paenibacillus dokdonensis]MEC0240150.1 glycosyltransferase [Paenibacillus dokdonensis]